MKRRELKVAQRRRRKRGLRKRIFGTPQRPRLTVFRSARHIYAQLVDDLAGRTLVSASTQDKALRSEARPAAGNRDAAAQVGKAIAERATSAGVQTIVFDRNGYRYHGRIRALADAAREGGLKF